MSEKITKKRVVLNRDTDFTPSTLVRWLNSEYKHKSSGREFTIRDVQQYTMRGFLPKHYGGHTIQIIEEDSIGIKVLRIKPKG